MKFNIADSLPAWIDSAIETDLVPIARFARTLNRDFDAVKNTIEMPWSNGQAEGQINRLKTLKRAMYGGSVQNCCGRECYHSATQIEEDPI
ncbi:MAG: transposase [Loktanella sp.]|nr:transposase [Loktanella sp.]